MAEAPVWFWGAIASMSACGALWWCTEEYYGINLLRFVMPTRAMPMAWQCAGMNRWSPMAQRGTMASDGELIRVVGLDIGTNKVAAIVSEITPDGTLEVIGLGSYPSR